MRCNTIFRLLSSGHIAKVDPPEFQTSPHTVYYTNQETVQLKAYKSYMAGPHTATEWQIWSGPAGTGTLLFDSQEDTSDLQSTAINFPITYPSIVYMRARQWAMTRDSDWSDDLVLSFEYCVPFKPLTGYVVYNVTAGNGWQGFQNNNAVWVEKNGQTNDILVGAIVTIYIDITVSASDNLYNIMYSCDDDCQVLAYNSTTQEMIVNWNDLGSDHSVPGLHSRGWNDGVSKDFSLPSGSYTFVFNLYNDPAPGPNWSSNPGGAGFIITEKTSGNLVSKSRDWASSGAYNAVFCEGGAMGTDGECHCITKVVYTPNLTSDPSPIVVNSPFNLVGSNYYNNSNPHKRTSWTLTSAANASGTSYISELPYDDTATTDIKSSSVTLPTSAPSTLYASVTYYAEDGSSSKSSETTLTMEYCTPYAASTGVGVYVPTISGNVQNWGAFMKSHGIWVNYTGDNDVLGGTWVSISRTISIPAGTYFCQLNADNHGEVYIDGVKVLSSDRFDSPDSLTTTISNTASGSTNHTFTLRAQNNISDGTSWTDNPAGIAFVMFQGTDTSGTTVVDTANWPNNPDVLVKYCPGQSELSISDGLCHCYTSSEIPS